jgi:hypothetical protein
VVPVPFEYQAIKFDWKKVKEALLAQDVLQWKTRPTRVLMSPKARNGFRSITQLDPLDFIVFVALIKDIAKDIEARRIPVAQERVFSYRVNVKSGGQIFNHNIGYRQFLEKCQRKLATDASILSIATTDISDFYSRIYHHRLENALQIATPTKINHIRALMNMLSGWNATESHGIPIGSAPTRLLAELTLSDVDEAMLAAGFDFIRFNDDYRIFCKTYEESYRAVAFLADVLSRNHGLSLQAQKTGFYDRNQFREKFLTTPLDREMDSLHSRFEDLVRELGLNDWYEEIDYDDLTEEQQVAIDSLNLEQLLREELDEDEPELPLIRFVLRRLGQLGNDAVLDDLFDNFEKIHPSLPDICRYVRNLRYLNPSQKSDLGARMLSLLDGPVVKGLEYHRMWILDLFVSSREWDNEQKFYQLYAAETDPACRRNLILAMGRAHQTHWFQSQWRTLFDQAHWSRRAVLAGASCLAADARKHWFRSVESQLDILELAVIRWATKHPF